MKLLCLVVTSAVVGIVFVQIVHGVEQTESPKEISGHRNIGLINRDGCGTAPKRDMGPLFQVPWMALLVYNTSRGQLYSCGGTIISDRYVLTAAHCVKNIPKSTKLTSVRLGEYDYTESIDCTEVEGRPSCADPPLDVGIERIIPHRSYTQKGFRHNIALLRLKNVVKFTSNSIRPICLPIATEERQRWFHEGELLTVVGWGTSTTGVQSPVVRQVHVEYVALADCVTAYRNLTKSVEIFEDQMCLRGTVKGDATSGDGGGPLVAGGFETMDKVIQYGVVSFGPASAIVNPPGVYTRVGSYIKWILDHMEPNPPQKTG